jgi:hypothetical protein
MHGGRSNWPVQTFERKLLNLKDSSPGHVLFDPLLNIFHSADGYVLFYLALRVQCQAEIRGKEMYISYITLLY